MNMCDIKKSVYSALIFFSTLVTLSVGYGALFGGLTDADKVGSGSWLTATSWNRIIDGVLDIDTRLSNLSFSGGNVGIGMANPAHKLDVAGNISASGWLYGRWEPWALGAYLTSVNAIPHLYYTSRTPNDGTGLFPFNNYGEMIFQGSTRAGYNNGFSWITGSANIGNTPVPTAKMRLTEIGNLGIGTTDPSQRLDLGGGVIGDGVIGGGIKIGGGGIGSSGSCILSAYSDQSSCPAGWTRLAPGLCAKCQ